MILIESIHETIAQLLSLGIAETLFKHLERTYSIEKDEIPDRLDALVSILDNTLGESAKIVEKTIAVRFYSRLGLSFSNDPHKTLVDFVEHAKMTQHE